MKKLFFLTLIGSLILSCSKESDLQHQAQQKHLTPAFEKSSNAASKQRADVWNGVFGTVVGSASITRTKNGIQATFTANDASPGFTYTMWWVIWNHPEECATPYACFDPDFVNPDVGVQVIYGGGNVSGASGKITISGHLREGEIDGNINDIFGLGDPVGIEDATHAEIHLVLRNHGPAVPGVVNDQINTYPGGCEVDLGLFLEIPDEVGECADTHFSVFASPDAL